KFTEIGPASPTGFPFKLKQVNSIIDLKDGQTRSVIYYEQQSTAGKLGDKFKFVELSIEQAAIVDATLPTGATSAQIWNRAVSTGATVQEAVMTEEGLKSAGRLFRDGKLVSDGVTLFSNGLVLSHVVMAE